MDGNGGARFEDICIRVYDGAQIYGRHYPAPGSKRRPLLCLAGLTRNSRDFHDLAMALSGDAEGARPVYTIDTRGRGQSDYAKDWRGYTVPGEMLDVQDFMAAQHLHKVAILGTSRGGLIAMVLAAAQPSLIGTVILNDIGPTIEHVGLLRISGYVGKQEPPLTWEQAGQRIAAGEREFFPDIEADAWQEIARQRLNEVNGKPAPAYDPEISRTLGTVSNGPPPPLWKQFNALNHVPCLVLRGELSDLLSAETVTAMTERHPDCSAHTVPRQGHAPLLADTPTQAVISDFLKTQDGLAAH
ncbi:MAG: alpha/beta fold hydrolase [Hyphomicrobiaceae bacterium]